MRLYSNAVLAGVIANRKVKPLESIYDWVTVAIFAGLTALMLQRTMSDDRSDSLWQYFPPAVGCAVANYLGNHDQAILAILTLVATLGFIAVVLKPFKKGSRP